MKTAQAKIQKFGSLLSAMVMPNIGVFIGWGLLTALFIDTGWTPNAYLNKLVSPILTYLLPCLIGYTAGSNIYGRRGGVIGAFATMGAVVGADVTMLVAGMILGPVAAICIRAFDKAVEGKVKPGLEMLVDNFSLGIIGFVICIIGYVGTDYDSDSDSTDRRSSVSDRSQYAAINRIVCTACRNFILK